MLAGKLDGNFTVERAIERLPQRDSIDFRFALNVQIYKRLLDGGERILPVLQAQGRVIGGDGERILEVEQRVEAFRSPIPGRQDIAVAGKILVFESDDAALLYDGGRLIDVEINRQYVGRPLLEENIKNTIAGC